MAHRRDRKGNQSIPIGILLLGVLLSGCVTPSQPTGFQRGLSGKVETSKGTHVARYNSWYPTTATSPESSELGVGIIASEDFPGEWMLERRSSMGDDEVVVKVMDRDFEIQQRFVAQSGSVYFLKSPKAEPLLLADDWEPAPMLDDEPPGPPSPKSFRVYTRALLENSTRL